MLTVLLILVAVALVVVLVGVCCEIAGGSFLGWMLLVNGSVGSLLEALAYVVAAIFEAIAEGAK